MENTIVQKAMSLNKGVKVVGETYLEDCQKFKSTLRW